MRRRPRLEVYRDRRGQWRWRLKAANGRILADSGEGYASRAGARRAAGDLWQAAFGAQIVDAKPRKAPRP